MYDPRRVLQKYQNKLSELLGVDVTKVKTLAINQEPEPAELTMVEKMMKEKQQRRVASQNARNKGPDVEAMLREVKQKARSLRRQKRKDRPPRESDCRASVVEDPLNCKKYIAQRMERAGQNSEYDSSFFFSMYRKAQPQPLRYTIRKVQMMQAADEATQDKGNNSVSVAEKKKSLFEGQIDLVSQYLTQHKQEQLAKDKTLEIKLAQAMILQVQKDLNKQAKTKKRLHSLESANKFDIKRPQTSCSQLRRGQDRYRKKDLDQFESVPQATRACTARQSTQDLTLNTFHLNDTPTLTEFNQPIVKRPQTSSLKQKNRLRYSTLLNQVGQFKQLKERQAVCRFERKNDKFYDKQLESVRKSSQELEDVFSVIQDPSQRDKCKDILRSGPNNLVQVAQSLQSYFGRKIDSENASPRFQQKLKRYNLLSNSMSFKHTNIKIKKKLQCSIE